MSKSRGNIVRAETVQEVLGADALRYFLLREIPFGQDGSFTFDALVQRYNGDLANGYGNLVSRVVNMVHKYFGGVVPEAGVETAAEAALRQSAAAAIAAFGPAFDDLNFSDALKSLWLLVADTDGYLTANAPWKKPANRSEADHARSRRASWPRPPKPFASSPRWSIPSCPTRPPRSGVSSARAKSVKPQNNHSWPISPGEA